MITTILFDLDGTLLQFSQDEFIKTYFGKLQKVFVRLGYDAEQSTGAVWSGTKAMLQNDGAKLNCERFWEKFAAVMNLTGSYADIEEACEHFYSHEFDTVKSVLKNGDSGLPRRMVRNLIDRGFELVLATNPLFPTCAVTTRLSWVGLTPQDFSLITDYTNSRYCKPSPGYFQEIFKALNREPGQCLMVGNSAVEDLSVGALGADIFLVTEYLENESGADISGVRSGTLADVERYLASLPDPV